MQTSNIGFPQPLLLCGLPKSGTTLLSAILDGHPELLVFPTTTNFINRVLTNREGDQDISEWLNSIHFEYISEDANIHSTLRSAIMCEWDRSPKRTMDMFESLFKGYRAVLAPSLDGSKIKYHVEKSTKNEFSLNELASRVGAYKAIYILRDPMDNFSSWRIRLRNHNNKDLSLLTYLHNLFLSIYAWFRLSNKTDNHLLVSYSKLVNQPELVTREISEFLDISWNDSMLQPTVAGNSWRGNSTVHPNFTGISNASEGVHKGRLSTSETSILRHVRKLLHDRVLETKNTEPMKLVPFLHVTKALLADMLFGDLPYEQRKSTCKLFLQALYVVNRI